MSWIDDEAKKAKQFDEEKTRREQAYEQQVWGLWRDLQNQVKEDVDGINANAELVSRRLGGEKLRIGQHPDGADGFQVTKIVYTAVYLNVAFRQRYLEVERLTVPNGPDRQTSKARERFDIDIDPHYHLYFKDDGNNPITVADLSRRLLTPLLNA